MFSPLSRSIRPHLSLLILTVNATPSHRHTESYVNKLATFNRLVICQSQAKLQLLLPVHSSAAEPQRSLLAWLQGYSLLLWRSKRKKGRVKENIWETVLLWKTHAHRRHQSHPHPVVINKLSIYSSKPKAVDIYNPDLSVFKALVWLSVNTVTEALPVLVEGPAGLN